MNGIIKKADLQLAVNEELKVGCYLYDRDDIYRIKAVNDDGSVVVDTVNPETLEVIDNTFKKDYRIGKDNLHYYSVLGVDVEKIKQMAERLLNGETFEEFTESSDTALMSLGSKDTLMILRENINRAAIVAEKTRKYADIMIQRKTRELEARLRPMRDMIEKMGREVKRLDYVIQTIETYAGIKESVEQLHAGEPAPETTPIVFRQAVIFMDEELALIDDDFDWQKVDKFDEWLLQNESFYSDYKEKNQAYTFQIRFPALFGDNEEHELKTYWTIPSEKYYNDHYAICNRAVLDGQELSDIAYIDHPNGVKEEKSNRITIVIP